MAITIGLDFGTHQTKICIEDTADKQNPCYYFWKFNDENSQLQYVCPSVIQLNSDGTLSYGYVGDRIDCKLIRYRYFKQATFSVLNWKHDVSPIMLSIWYIANIIFDLEEKYGKNFQIQMGIPTGAHDFEKKKQLATSILLSAYTLVEDMFNNNKQDFLSSTIDELKILTDIIPYSKSLKTEYGILVFPEAYAGLRMMTSRKKIVRGMNLNIDIGGGTTDISFFTIDKDKPHIYRYESLPIGINWIMQQSESEDSILKSCAFLDFNSSSETYIDRLYHAISLYQKELLSTHNNIIKMIWNEWIEKMGATHKSYLTDALRNRPAIYMGGGSTYRHLRKPIVDFSEVHIVDGGFWSGVNIEDVGDLYPILNTALGLAVGEINDDIEIHSINDLWEGVGGYDNKSSDFDYGLSDVD